MFLHLVLVLTITTPSNAASVHNIPVNCVGKWSEPTTCSETCGEGTQTKTFIVTREAKFGGKECAYKGKNRALVCLANTVCVGTTEIDGLASMETGDIVTKQQLKTSMENVVSNAVPGTKVSVTIINLEYMYHLSVPSTKMDTQTFKETKATIRNFIRNDLDLVNPTIQDGAIRPAVDEADNPTIDITFSVPDEGVGAAVLIANICKASDLLCFHKTNDEASLNKIVTDVEYTATLDSQDPSTVEAAQSSLEQPKALSNEVETSTNVQVLNLIVAISSEAEPVGEPITRMSEADAMSMTTMIIILIGVGIFCCRS